MGFSIQDKVALVTGANRGIGKSIVESFLAHGAKKVYLAVRDTASTEALEQQFGDRVVTLQADVSDAESITQLAAQTNDVDIVVNNAGIMKLASPSKSISDPQKPEYVDVQLFL